MARALGTPADPSSDSVSVPPTNWGLPTPPRPRPPPFAGGAPAEFQQIGQKATPFAEFLARFESLAARARIADAETKTIELRRKLSYELSDKLSNQPNYQRLSFQALATLPHQLEMRDREGRTTAPRFKPVDRKVDGEPTPAYCARRPHPVDAGDPMDLSAAEVPRQGEQLSEQERERRGTTGVCFRRSSLATTGAIARPPTARSLQSSGGKSLIAWCSRRRHAISSGA